MIRRGLLIFVESSLELAFYRSVVLTIQGQKKSLMAEDPLIIYKIINRIGNHQNSAIRIYQKQVSIDYPETPFDVILCHDSSIYKFSPKPPTDWKLVESDLKVAGVQHVDHIIANKSIEDWLLIDYPGVLNFLNLPLDTILPEGDGITKFKCLYNKTNNVYVRDSESDALVQYLDINKITSMIHKQLRPLINLII
jgi:hypothetical protein